MKRMQNNELTEKYSWINWFHSFIAFDNSTLEVCLKSCSNGRSFSQFCQCRSLLVTNICSIFTRMHENTEPKVDNSSKVGYIKNNLANWGMFIHWYTTDWTVQMKQLNTNNAILVIKNYKTKNTIICTYYP